MGLVIAPFLDSEPLHINYRLFQLDDGSCQKGLVERHVKSQTIADANFVRDAAFEGDMANCVGGEL